MITHTDDEKLDPGGRSWSVEWMGEDLIADGNRGFVDLTVRGVEVERRVVVRWWNKRARTRRGGVLFIAGGRGVKGSNQ
jgi:hypothetical protein